MKNKFKIKRVRRHPRLEFAIIDPNGAMHIDQALDKSQATSICAKLNEQLTKELINGKRTS